MTPHPPNDPDTVEGLRAELERTRDSIDELVGSRERRIGELERELAALRPSAEGAKGQVCGLCNGSGVIQQGWVDGRCASCEGTGRRPSADDANVHPIPGHVYPSCQRCLHAEFPGHDCRPVADGPTQEEVERLVGAARAACDRWWGHGLQDGEGQRLMRTLGDICAGIGARPLATRADDQEQGAAEGARGPVASTPAGHSRNLPADPCIAGPAAPCPPPAAAPVDAEALARDLDAWAAIKTGFPADLGVKARALGRERDESDRKGRELCSAYGLVLIDLHDERAAREKAEAEVGRLRERVERVAERCERWFTPANGPQRQIVAVEYRSFQWERPGGVQLDGFRYFEVRECGHGRFCDETSSGGQVVGLIGSSRPCVTCAAEAGGE